MSHGRKPGPSAVVHREHRRKVGSRTMAPLPKFVPQWSTGPRFGQQLALLRALGVVP